MGTSTLATASVDELQAALELLRTRSKDEKAELAAPFVESILPHITFKDSVNGKPWHGATYNAELTTSDGRKVRLNCTITDVVVSDGLKAAAKKVAATPAATPSE